MMLCRKNCHEIFCAKCAGFFVMVPGTALLQHTREADPRRLFEKGLKQYGYMEMGRVRGLRVPRGDAALAGREGVFGENNLVFSVVFGTAVLRGAPFRDGGGACGRGTGNFRLCAAVCGSI